jgi:hypothetical protein
VSVQQTEVFPEAEDEAEDEVSTVLGIFRGTDLEYEVGECIGRSDKDIFDHQTNQKFYVIKFSL